MRIQSHYWLFFASPFTIVLEPHMIIVMSSNQRSLPDHFVGLLCFKCKRPDFGESARCLSPHVQYCNGPSQQLYKKILHCDENFTTSHPNGMAQFPFNMVHRNIIGNMNEVCSSNSDDDIELDNPDELYSNENNADNPSGLVNDQIIPNNAAVPSNIHHPSIQPTIEASKPFNLDVGMPSC